MSAKKKPFAVMGAGGHGRALASILVATGNKVVFLDDYLPPETERYIVGTSDKLRDAWFLESYNIAIGIGDEARRFMLATEALTAGAPLPRIIHHLAFLDPSSLLGAGVQLFPGAIVGAHVNIGLAAIINSRASVAHDCTIGSGSQVADGATLGGGVTVGQRTLIGLGAVVLPKVVIGDDVIVGAGAVVTKDIAHGGRVAGVPARPIQLKWGHR